MDWLQRVLPTVQGRLTTAAALIAAIVIGLWPDHSRPLDPAKASVIVLTGLAWLFAEINGASKPTDHDVALFKRYRETLREEDRSFLREHNFWNSFQYHRSEGLRELAYWDGAAHEFMDRRVQGRWKEVIQGIDAFVMLMAKYTAPVNAAAGLLSVHPKQGDPENPEEWILKEINELNEASRALHQITEDFERFARERLLR
ncbi:hypothetical protein [Sphingomonas abietis]|uniref:SMODS and SLOG-associating 2TM effector domain-containing protein n=1 Tax=Sphingomonas abietis TaxID=3012344 RepID=A0ABY7NP45_9SPHN|nr:hypothetical protein [Sphingomonas abietis]WBO22715.1 hypothetical protein PBT88_00735 [Sphingomonas abietis]